MLSACASIHRGMEAVLAAERNADRDMLARVAEQERRSRGQHAALKAAGGRLERQGAALRRQQAAVARLGTTLNGPSGLRDRLAAMQGALQRITAELAMIEAGTRTRAAASFGSMPAADAPAGPGGPGGPNGRPPGAAT